MNKLILLTLLLLSGCAKIGVGGMIEQAKGNWAEVHTPEGCVVTQIAAEENSGTAILCADGRVFH